MSTVLIAPRELHGTAQSLFRAAAQLSETGAAVLAQTAGLPAAVEAELGTTAALLGLRLERLAAEVAAEGLRQEAVAARAILADAMGAARRIIDTRTTGFWSQLIQAVRFTAQETWTMTGRVLPYYINVVGLGYRLERRGAVIIARGERLFEPGLLQRWIMTERPRGTRYLRPNPILEQELLGFTHGNPLGRAGTAAWEAVSHDAWMVRGPEALRMLRRGGGPASLALSLVPDAWDYASGTRAREGLLSSGFASSVVTDLSISLGQVGVSAAAGAAAGSLVPVPGAGTAVGFGTGLVIGAAVEFTPWGRGARNAVQHAIKSEIDDSISGGRQLLQLGAQPHDPRPGPTSMASPWDFARALGR